MAKNLKETVLEIGTKFQKGDVTLVLIKIERGMAIFHRTWKGSMRILETTSLGHLKSCPSIYRRIEATEGGNI